MLQLHPEDHLIFPTSTAQEPISIYRHRRPHPGFSTRGSPLEHETPRTIFVAPATKPTTQPLTYSAGDLLFGCLHWLNDGTPDIGCFDTMSQVSIQNDSYPLPPNTKIISENDGTTIEGVGGMITEAGTLYSVEILLRLGTAPVAFEF